MTMLRVVACFAMALLRYFRRALRGGTRSGQGGGVERGPPALSAGIAAVLWALALSPVHAQTSLPGTVSVPTAKPVPAEMGVADWLARMHAVSRARTYVGTSVVSAGASMSSARIWHACSGDVQLERVESLSGQPRSTFRRNEQVVTFLPGSRVVRTETRESLGLFPALLRAADVPLGEFYTALPQGLDRVAGFDADVVQLRPRDNLRFGYRVWSEKASGLVVKLQTLDVDGRVLEQAAFSDLQLDAPVSVAKLSQMMQNTDGYRIEKSDVVRTSPQAEGWAMRNPVPGFRSMSCQKRSLPAAEAGKTEGAVQWVFSDGLASVSVFVEAFDPRLHLHEGATAQGATQTLTRRLKDRAGDWWVTVVGEAPHKTLAAFAQGLERTQ